MKYLFLALVLLMTGCTAYGVMPMAPQHQAVQRHTQSGNPMNLSP